MNGEQHIWIKSCCGIKAKINFNKITKIMECSIGTKILTMNFSISAFEIELKLWCLVYSFTRT
jgi:hypothetical protein